MENSSDPLFNALSNFTKMSPKEWPRRIKDIIAESVNADEIISYISTLNPSEDEKVVQYGRDVLAPFVDQRYAAILEKTFYLFKKGIEGGSINNIKEFIEFINSEKDMDLAVAFESIRSIQNLKPIADFEKLYDVNETLRKSELQPLQPKNKESEAIKKKLIEKINGIDWNKYDPLLEYANLSKEHAYINPTLLSNVIMKLVKCYGLECEDGGKKKEEVQSKETPKKENLQSKVDKELKSPECKKEKEKEMREEEEESVSKESKKKSAADYIIAEIPIPANIMVSTEAETSIDIKKWINKQLEFDMASIIEKENLTPKEKLIYFQLNGVFEMHTMIRKEVENSYRKIHEFNELHNLSNPAKKANKSEEESERKRLQASIDESLKNKICQASDTIKRCFDPLQRADIVSLADEKDLLEPYTLPDDETKFSEFHKYVIYFYGPGKKQIPIFFMEGFAEFIKWNLSSNISSIGNIMNMIRNKSVYTSIIEKMQSSLSCFLTLFTKDQLQPIKVGSVDIDLKKSITNEINTRIKHVKQGISFHYFDVSLPTFKLLTPIERLRIIKLLYNSRIFDSFMAIQLKEYYNYVLNKKRVLTSNPTCELTVLELVNFLLSIAGDKSYEPSHTDILIEVDSDNENEEENEELEKEENDAKEKETKPEKENNSKEDDSKSEDSDDYSNNDADIYQEYENSETEKKYTGFFKLKKCESFRLTCKMIAYGILYLASKTSENKDEIKTVINVFMSTINKITLDYIIYSDLFRPILFDCSRFVLRSSIFKFFTKNVYENHAFRKSGRKGLVSFDAYVSKIAEIMPPPFFKYCQSFGAENIGKLLIKLIEDAMETQLMILASEFGVTAESDIETIMNFMITVFGTNNFDILLRLSKVANEFATKKSSEKTEKDDYETKLENYYKMLSKRVASQFVGPKYTVSLSLMGKAFDTVCRRLKIPLDGVYRYFSNIFADLTAKKKKNTKEIITHEFYVAIYYSHYLEKNNNGILDESSKLTVFQSPDLNSEWMPNGKLLLQVDEVLFTQEKLTREITYKCWKFDNTLLENMAIGEKSNYYEIFKDNNLFGLAEKLEPDNIFTVQNSVTLGLLQSNIDKEKKNQPIKACLTQCLDISQYVENNESLIIEVDVAKEKKCKILLRNWQNSYDMTINKKELKIISRDFSELNIILNNNEELKSVTDDYNNFYEYEKVVNMYNENVGGYKILIKNKDTLMDENSTISSTMKLNLKCVKICKNTKTDDICESDNTNALYKYWGGSLKATIKPSQKEFTKIIEIINPTVTVAVPEIVLETENEDDLYKLSTMESDKTTSMPIKFFIKNLTMKYTLNQNYDTEMATCFVKPTKIDIDNLLINSFKMTISVTYFDLESKVSSTDVDVPLIFKYSYDHKRFEARSMFILKANQTITEIILPQSVVIKRIIPGSATASHFKPEVTTSRITINNESHLNLCRRKYNTHHTPSIEYKSTIMENTDSITFKMQFSTPVAEDVNDNQIKRKYLITRPCTSMPISLISQNEFAEKERVLDLEDNDLSNSLNFDYKTDENGDFKFIMNKKDILSIANISREYNDFLIIIPAFADYDKNKQRFNYKNIKYQIFPSNFLQTIINNCGLIPLFKQDSSQLISKTVIDSLLREYMEMKTMTVKVNIENINDDIILPFVAPITENLRINGVYSYNDVLFECLNEKFTIHSNNKNKNVDRCVVDALKIPKKAIFLTVPTYSTLALSYKLEVAIPEFSFICEIELMLIVSKKENDNSFTMTTDSNEYITTIEAENPFGVYECAIAAQSQRYNKVQNWYNTNYLKKLYSNKVKFNSENLKNYIGEEKYISSNKDYMESVSKEIRNIRGISLIRPGTLKNPISTTQLDIKKLEANVEYEKISYTKDACLSMNEKCESCDQSEFIESDRMYACNTISYKRSSRFSSKKGCIGGACGISYSYDKPMLYSTKCNSMPTESNTSNYAKCKKSKRKLSEQYDLSIFKYTSPNITYKIMNLNFTAPNIIISFPIVNKSVLLEKNKVIDPIGGIEKFDLEATICKANSFIESKVNSSVCNGSKTFIFNNTANEATNILSINTYSSLLNFYRKKITNAQKKNSEYKSRLYKFLIDKENMTSDNLKLTYLQEKNLFGDIAVLLHLAFFDRNFYLTHIYDYVRSNKAILEPSVIGFWLVHFSCYLGEEKVSPNTFEATTKAIVEKLVDTFLVQQQKCYAVELLLILLMQNQVNPDSEIVKFYMENKKYQLCTEYKTDWKKLQKTFEELTKEVSYYEDCMDELSNAELIRRDINVEFQVPGSAVKVFTNELNNTQFKYNFDSFYYSLAAKYLYDKGARIKTEYLFMDIKDDYINDLVLSDISGSGALYVGYYIAEPIEEDFPLFNNCNEEFSITGDNRAEVDVLKQISSLSSSSLIYNIQNLRITPQLKYEYIFSGYDEVINSFYAYRFDKILCALRTADCLPPNLVVPIKKEIYNSSYKVVSGVSYNIGLSLLLTNTTNAARRIQVVNSLDPLIDIDSISKKIYGNLINTWEPVEIAANSSHIVDISFSIYPSNTIDKFKIMEPKIFDAETGELIELFCIEKITNLMDEPGSLDEAEKSLFSIDVVNFEQIVNQFKTDFAEIMNYSKNKVSSSNDNEPIIEIDEAPKKIRSTTQPAVDSDGSFEKMGMSNVEYISSRIVESNLEKYNETAILLKLFSEGNRKFVSESMAKKIETIINFATAEPIKALVFVPFYYALSKMVVDKTCLREDILGRLYNGIISIKTTLTYYNIENSNLEKMLAKICSTLNERVCNRVQDIYSLNKNFSFIKNYLFNYGNFKSFALIDTNISAQAKLTNIIKNAVKKYATACVGFMLEQCDFRPLILEKTFDYDAKEDSRNLELENYYGELLALKVIALRYDLSQNVKNTVLIKLAYALTLMNKFTAAFANLSLIDYDGLSSVDKVIYLYIEMANISDINTDLIENKSKRIWHSIKMLFDKKEFIKMCNSLNKNSAMSATNEEHRQILDTLVSTKRYTDIYIFFDSLKQFALDIIIEYKLKYDLDTNKILSIKNNSDLEMIAQLKEEISRYDIDSSMTYMKNDIRIVNFMQKMKQVVTKTPSFAIKDVFNENNLKYGIKIRLLNFTNIYESVKLRIMYYNQDLAKVLVTSPQSDLADCSESKRTEILCDFMNDNSGLFSANYSKEIIMTKCYDSLLKADYYETEVINFKEQDKGSIMKAFIPIDLSVKPVSVLIPNPLTIVVNNSSLFVTNNGKICKGAYVSVFAIDNNRKVSFWKDGFTDLFGAFNFVSTSSGCIANIKYFNAYAEYEDTTTFKYSIACPVNPDEKKAKLREW